MAAQPSGVSALRIIKNHTFCMSQEEQKNLAEKWFVSFHFVGKISA